MNSALYTREYIKGLFLRTLSAVDVSATMAAQLSCDGGELHVGHLRYQLDQFDRIVVIAAGKAALPMSDTFVRAVTPHLPQRSSLTGIVVAGTLPDTRIPQFRYYKGAHPLPDEISRIAAENILSLLAACTEQTLVFFLISGGASAMVEKPLDDAITVDETSSFYRALVHSGLSIVQMNVIRKHFSAVKGGRLAQAAGAATQCTLIVSDVPEGALNMVGSGPSVPDNSTIEECRRILADNDLTHTLSPAVTRLLLATDLPETVKHQAPAFAKASHLCLLCNADLRRAAAALAAADGYHVVIDKSCDDWEYEKAGAHLLSAIRALGEGHPKVCLISGGEVSVRLPAKAGVGGRNQHFALWCALHLRQTPSPITVLSAGTDGLDGNSHAAGAIVDSKTCDEGERVGLDPVAFLQRFDSFTFFNQIGATLNTGPTHNNIRDLRILISDR